MRSLLHRAHSTNIEIHIHNIFTWVNQRVANFVYSVISFRHFYWQNININRTIYVVHSSNSIFKITSDVSIVIYVTEACMLHAQISYSSVLFKVFSLICLRAFAIHHQHYIYIYACVYMARIVRWNVRVKTNPPSIYLWLKQVNAKRKYLMASKIVYIKRNWESLLYFFSLCMKFHLISCFCCWWCWCCSSARWIIMFKNLTTSQPSKSNGE